MPINPLVAVGDIIEVVVRCQSPNVQAGINVLHYVVSEGVGGAVGLANIASSLGPTLGTVYVPLLHNLAEYVGVTLAIVFPLPRSYAVFSVGPPAPGTAGPLALPDQTCGLITKLTGLGGRHGRGRLYVPFPAVASATPLGQPTSAYLASLIDLGLAIQAPVTVTVGSNSVTLSPCLINRSVPLGLAATNPIQGFTVRTGFATQRRRSYFGRANPL